MGSEIKEYDLNFEKSECDIRRENELLKNALVHVKSELQKFKNPPLVVCEVKKVLGDKAVVRLSNGHNFMVNLSSSLSGKIKPSDQVLAEQKSLTLIDKIEPINNNNIEKFIILEKPDITWSEIGGNEKPIRELREVVELPLKKPELFKKIGIHPPKGVLLYGPPGCGKTLLGKAVARSTDACFIEVVASELVQKFIGEGAKLVKELFKTAKEKAPAIIFIDEIDALASFRMDVGTSGEREVQRTFMQFLAELDGFEALGNVKVIGATNRIDIIDSALLRPGRFDRLIEVGEPKLKGRYEIFKIHTSRMNLNDVDLKELAIITKDFTGADIKSVCTESGYLAIREDREHVTHKDFVMSINKVKGKSPSDQGYLSMFG